MYEVADSVLNAYAPYITENDIDYTCIGNGSYQIPRFSEDDLIELCTQSIEVLKTEPRILKIHKHAFVFGDLHGNLVDLIRLLHIVCTDPDRCIVFLGDYVDRGDYSVEVVTLLFAMKVSHPDRIYLIRGNHEFRHENTVYGFRESLLKDYSEILYESINNVFDYLPLCAIILDKIFCVHGGISPLLSKLSYIEEIPAPLKTYEDTEHCKLLKDLMWSDPSVTVDTYIDNKRGLGCVYGAAAVRQFLFVNGFTGMLRAHQCVAAGVMPFANRALYTVFSSSCYATGYDNSCGFVEIDSMGHFLPYNLDPVRSVPRQFARFEMFSGHRPDIKYVPHAISTFARHYASRQRKRSMTQVIQLTSKKLQKTGSGNTLPKPRGIIVPKSLIAEKKQTLSSNF